MRCCECYKGGVARHALPRPTDGELEILAVLWGRGGSTVREVHETLQAERPLHYNTVLKILQIMLEKGIVLRDDTVRPQVYRAAISRAHTEKHLIKDLMRRVFGNSAKEFVMRALDSRRATPEEIEEIRKKLDRMERGE